MPRPKDREKVQKERNRGKRGDALDYGCAEQRTFITKLAEGGLVIYFMEPDGNCLFRSLASQALDDAERHAEIRAKVMDFEEAQPDHFRLFIEDDEPFDDYIERMRRDGEWGGHPELFAAAQVLGVDISVHQADSPILLLEGPASIRGPRRTLRLSYHGQCHYNTLVLDESIKQPVGVDRGEALRATMEAVCWATEQRASLALRTARGDVDEAIELLMTGSEQLDELEAVEAEAVSEEAPPRRAKGKLPRPVTHKHIALSKKDSRKLKKSPPLNSDATPKPRGEQRHVIVL